MGTKINTEILLQFEEKKIDEIIEYIVDNCVLVQYHNDEDYSIEIDRRMNPILFKQHIMDLINDGL